MHLLLSWYPVEPTNPESINPRKQALGAAEGAGGAGGDWELRHPRQNRSPNEVIECEVGIL